MNRHLMLFVHVNSHPNKRQNPPTKLIPSHGIQILPFDILTPLPLSHPIPIVLILRNAHLARLVRLVLMDICDESVIEEDLAGMEDRLHEMAVRAPGYRSRTRGWVHDEGNVGGGGATKGIGRAAGEDGLE
jgi:hypothetical protein